MDGTDPILVVEAREASRQVAHRYLHGTAHAEPVYAGSLQEAYRLLHGPRLQGALIDAHLLPEGVSAPSPFTPQPPGLIIAGWAHNQHVPFVVTTSGEGAPHIKAIQDYTALKAWAEVDCFNGPADKETDAFWERAYRELRERIDLLRNGGRR